MGGHLEKRSKKGWTIVLDFGADPVTKKQRRKKFALKNVTKAEAQKVLNKMLAEVDAGTYVEPTGVTVSDYLRKWLHIVEPNLATRTVQGYRTNIERHIIPAIGSIRLIDLRPTHLQTFYADMLDNYKPRTVQYVHANLRAALGQAVFDGEVTRNVADMVKAPRPTRHEMKTLLPSEADKLLAACEGSYIADVVFLALHTGLRRGELLALRWRDIDLDDCSLRVERSLVRADGRIEFKPPKSALSRRVVPFDEDTASRLRAMPHTHKLVFCYNDGTPLDPSSVTHTFSKLAVRAGFDGLRFHDLRHTYITLLIASGTDLPTAQELAGHENISTTRIYAHTIDARKRSAANGIGLVLGSAGKHQISTNPSEKEETES